MKAIVFVLFAVALGANLRATEFLNFKKEYGKLYSSTEENNYRMAVFNENLEKIAIHNAQNHHWTMGVNKFADITEEEFLHKFCGCAKDPRTRSGRVTPVFGNAPERIDWRDKGAVTPVKNQASCGSCWAFSSTGTVEGAYFVHSGELISLSEQQLVDCATVPKYENEGCNGGWPWSALDYVHDKGLCTEEEYPYHGRDEDCKDDKCKVVVQSAGRVVLPQMDEESLKNAVAMHPVSIVLDASVLHLYKGGIIDKCNEEINHAVLAVGYDTDAETGMKYWIVKNSWDTNWGEKGYFRIEREAGGMGRCGLTYSSTYPTF